MKPWPPLLSHPLATFAIFPTATTSTYFSESMNFSGAAPHWQLLILTGSSWGCAFTLVWHICQGKTGVGANLVHAVSSSAPAGTPENFLATLTRNSLSLHLYVLTPAIYFQPVQQVKFSNQINEKLKPFLYQVGIKRNIRITPLS